jgi:hypothetical protein
MEIDPVVFLAEELRSKERALRDAVKRYEKDHARENGEIVNNLLLTLKVLYREFFETVPTSVLVRMAAQRLPFSLARYANHFHEVADRLSEGKREHADLVWLRAMRSALKEGEGGEQGVKTAPLLGLALRGAARPVVVFRAFAPPPDDDIPARTHHGGH